MDRQLQIRILVEGGIAALASVISLVSLSKGLRSWFENGSADLPFLLCCAALVVNYVFSQRFVARLLDTAVTSITAARRDLLARATLGPWSSIQERQRERSFEHCQRLLEQIGVLLPGLSIAANMLILTVVAYAYFWTVSVSGALLILLGIMVLASRHVHHMAVARRYLRQAEIAAERNAGGVAEILRGSIEIRLGKARRDTMLTSVDGAIADWDTLRRAHGGNVAELFSWINVFLVILSALVVFIFPRLGIVSAAELPTLTMVLLFLIRPLAKFLNTVPDIVAAEDAARRIAEIRAALPSPEFRPMPSTDADMPFETITLAGVEYSYTNARDSRGFSVGPVDLTIRAGEVVGIFGRNGSGKSTVLKMIPLLVRPERGEVLLDGLPVGSESLEAYRNLFCGVFQDDHVFSALPQGGGFDRDLFYDMLDFLDIAHLVQVEADGRLDYTLSRGQRRRLALAIAVAEGRRIMILDEWTADQDQSYRQRFRGEILWRLRSHGLTVILVSHDEHAADLCDHTLFLSKGRMQAAPVTLSEVA
ncbi:ATP-binding cassette domain-containing protein [Paracraurococcus lichenis]|uniref:ATP-binding cassette domain-containing protein n=1 Tax=Paracraurococcus lichenis TaxID=3064888 RepID=A0ABT9E943_9PROT|nr:ATP-binding cassette domain-containing protein [Paracraurococcus sp. LOR1-02]MDO9712721.1 ATP-binding cassette domain-containing protein [Paracraurococcus sp. LOR1-02]